MQIVDTLSDVLKFMSPFAGGSIPSEGSTEYNDWVRWVQVKQEEFAKRGFWRRLLRKSTISFSHESLVTLPDDFHKSNGLYMFIVDGEDWTEEDSDVKLFVGMNLDSSSADYGKWYVEFNEPKTGTATIWYFAQPKKPESSGDKIILPGDMIAYAALAEYFRTTGAEGSMDQANIDAENRFNSYITLEMIPSKWELLRFSSQRGKANFLNKARSYYASRRNRG